MEGLCRRKPQQHDTDSEHALNRAANKIQAESLDAGGGGGPGLLGREGAHVRDVLRRVRRVQSLAAGGVEEERKAQADMFETLNQELVVPSQDTP